MNDLISSSFKKYTDQKQQALLGDIEAGQTESGNLDEFFGHVEDIKEDMRAVEELHKLLQDANEEAKTVHDSKAMKKLRSRMDSDVKLVLKRVRTIKSKLEALEKSNEAQREVPGCGPGSSVDRTRTSVVSGLGKNLEDMMDDFQRLRAKISSEYKETVERRYFTVTGQRADEETIEKLISSGESERFLQKAIEEQGRGQIMETLSEIQERHDAVKEIERNLVELHEVFLDMAAAIVEAQCHMLNDIETNVKRASSFVMHGSDQLLVMKEHQKSSRKWTCLAIVLVVVLALVLLLPILSSVILH
ncbi:PREDICTED: syntaxin-123 [Tarenaya hassleriana]|uniref:syntaxin-123 n=1 Tax=Tarenaya hassleriana TaxID=28532 RepID=UPI00053C72A5|nr:PREDICTED: syntaxin-123 [Tarenaya hassleriana]